MRRNWKRITGIVLAFVLIIGQFMAGVSQTQAASKSPKLSRASLTLTVGQSRKLSVSNAKNVKWTSSNKKVATVNKNGTVKAKKSGKETITANNRIFVLNSSYIHGHSYMSCPFCFQHFVYRHNDSYMTHKFLFL